MLLLLFLVWLDDMDCAFVAIKKTKVFWFGSMTWIALLLCSCEKKLDYFGLV